MTTTPTTDAARLRATVDFVREQDTAALLPLLLPGADALELRALTERCRFSHAALLVFPDDLAALRAGLARCGLAADTPARPSVVVRDRLAARHGRTAEELDVQILRPTVPAAEPTAASGPEGAHRSVEVFALRATPREAGIAAHERARQHEAHVGFEVRDPDPLVLHGMAALLARHGAVPDGGGYNPHEDGTVFYFTAPADAKTEYRRVELYAPGDHREVLAAHLRSSSTAAPAEAPAETLLRLLTGAWAAQAVTAFARLGVADALPLPGTDSSVTPAPGAAPAALARAIGAEPDRLARLLRFLASCGVVTEDQRGRFALTESGALLRTDAPASMRPLALTYGGPFYQAFAHLDHTVRTGQVAFEHLYGAHHFDWFAREPEQAELFDRTMAASARMFEPLGTHPVVAAAGSAARPGTVVDVAGGTGTLLARLLTAQPRLRGLLLEREHVVAAARRTLDAAGCADRCDFRVGDFADVPPGGDVYVLSRVLHDWDDDRCREILRHCAAAMPAHADLLVVERVLPEDGTAAAARAWDLHMMCNVGGRERTAAQYARLLADAGLALVGASPLPLGGSVLHARRAHAGA